MFLNIEFQIKISINLLNSSPMTTPVTITHVDIMPRRSRSLSRLKKKILLIIDKI